MAKIDRLCKVHEPKKDLSVIAKIGDYYHRGIISKAENDKVSVYCVDNGTTANINSSNIWHIDEELAAIKTVAIQIKDTPLKPNKGTKVSFQIANDAPKICGFKTYDIGKYFNIYSLKNYFP